MAVKVANIVKKDNTHWEVVFEDIPEHIIPMLRVFPVFYTNTDSINWATSTFYYHFDYFWEQVNLKNWKLYFRISGYLRDSKGDEKPLYANLSVYFVNTQTRLSNQDNLGY